MIKNNQIKVRVSLFFLAIILVLLNLSCQDVNDLVQHQTTFETRDDFEEYFEDYEVEGSFLLYDLNHDHFIEVNPERNDSRFIPASTFKIMNSLIGLEAGVVKDQNHLIQWDGVKRDFSSWNQDHTLSSAIQNSVVWYYQEVARQIGNEQMQQYVSLAEYGNQDISGDIDSFWLDGELRISPMEQIVFLRDLYQNKLPFSDRSTDIVKEILLVEETDTFRLSAKTGLALRFDTKIGWWVGYLETDGNVYFFVINIESDQADVAFQNSRFEITDLIFTELGLPT